jgi:hypothetical protein
VDIQSDEWWAQDFIHFPELYLKETITSPLGKATNINSKVLTAQGLEKQFYDYTATSISYSEAQGSRVQHR